MARKDKKRRSGKEKISQSQLQAYRARQEAVLSREEVERKREEERRRQLRREEQMAAEAEHEYADVLGIRREEQEEVPTLSPEQIAADYQSVNNELVRIAIWGGVTILLLIAIAVYMT
jgi:F0F1-type ATP synthase membrane subunit b/b'